jgi:hypothetical protein
LRSQVSINQFVKKNINDLFSDDFFASQENKSPGVGTFFQNVPSL